MALRGQGLLYGHLVRPVLDLLYPRNCIACGGIVSGAGKYLCHSCWQRLPLIGPVACNGCGYPVYGDVVEPGRCLQCRGHESAYSRARALCLMQQDTRTLVHAFKYREGLYLQEDVQRLVEQSQHFRRFLVGAVLVPVPLHPTRLRERGFNQSEWLAATFARAAGAADVKSLLVRTRATATQTRLDRAGRDRNVKNAFALHEKAVVIPNLRYVIIDDVFTTGATLHACAETLREAGAVAVDVATFAHG